MFKGSYPTILRGLGLQVATYPKSPCTQIVYTLALKYPYRDYIIRPKYILFGYVDPYIRASGSPCMACPTQSFCWKTMAPSSPKPETLM